jgi:hypothetical protein
MALIFLIAISSLTLASMRSSSIGMRMAQNEEARITAQQGAQSLADAIVSDVNSTPVVNDVGYTICTSGETGCDVSTLVPYDTTVAAAVSAGYVSARVKRLEPLFRNPYRSGSGASGLGDFEMATFEVTATYDRSAAGLGKRRVAEGVMVLVPND